MLTCILNKYRDNWETFKLLEGGTDVSSGLSFIIRYWQNIYLSYVVIFGEM